MSPRLHRSDSYRRALRAMGPAAILGFFALNSTAATFVLENGDPNGFGLNDNTFSNPVGGNPGTTIGQQRQNVVLEAGRIWGQHLVSEVPIVLRVEFESLEGTSLAGAAPVDIESAFPNAPLTNVWYAVALANSLAGVDLQPGNPDIEITINANNDDWYYGFDSNASFNQTDLLDVLLHEIAHGLGFLTITNDTNGSFFRNQPDTFARFLFDHQQQRNWINLTNGERVASSTNDPFLTWTGPNTRAAQRSILEFNSLPSLFSLSALLSSGEDYPLSFIPAGFGPTVLSGSLEGLVILVDDGTDEGRDACEAIINTEELNGNIALIMRQECNFVDKVLTAQQAGASAAIIYNNIASDIVPMGTPEDFDDSPITIPSISISRADAVVLLDSLSRGPVSLSNHVDVAGTNNGGLRLYAPAFFDAGSSVSHWSTSASPDLLMEPFINRNLRDDLDLTLTLMKDIGWQVIDIPYPHFTYDIWAEDSLNGETRTAPGDDPDEDGIRNIEEYFFRGNPLKAEDDLLPLLRFTDTTLTYSFTRTLLSTDLVYTIEYSSDLDAWATATEGVDFEALSTIPLGTEAEEVTLRLREHSEPRYFRLRIEALN